MPRLLARIRRTYDADTGEQSYLEFFNRLSSVDLLHIDDLGAEKPSEWVMEQLYSLVNERYETSARSSPPPTSTSASSRSRSAPRTSPA